MILQLNDNKKTLINTDGINAMENWKEIKYLGLDLKDKFSIRLTSSVIELDYSRPRYYPIGSSPYYCLANFFAFLKEIDDVGMISREHIYYQYCSDRYDIVEGERRLVCSRELESRILKEKRLNVQEVIEYIDCIIGLRDKIIKDYENIEDIILTKKIKSGKIDKRYFYFTT